MSAHLIIDGNAVYEVDEDCMMRKYGRVEFWNGSQEPMEGGVYVTEEEAKETSGDA